MAREAPPRSDRARVAHSRTCGRRASDVDGCVLAHRDRVQPLPTVVRTGAATVASRRGLGHGTRSLHAWLDGLRLRRIEEHEWRPFDPGAETLIDVDREADIDRILR